MEQVVGVIAEISFPILKSSIQGMERDSCTKLVELAITKAAESGIASVGFTLALCVSYKLTHKWAVIILIITGPATG